MDALERACPPPARAALAALRSISTEQGSSEALAAILAACGGAPIIAVALAGWEAAAGREPRLSRVWAGRLERSAGQLDRLWGEGAAARWLIDRLGELSPAGVDAGSAELCEVATLAYYAAELRAVARQAARYERCRRGARQSAQPRRHRPRGRQ